MDALNQTIHGAAIVCATLVLLSSTAALCFGVWSLVSVIGTAIAQIRKDIDDQN